MKHTVVACLFAFAWLTAAAQPANVPDLGYAPAAEFFQLPPGVNFGAVRESFEAISGENERGRLTAVVARAVQPPSLPICGDPCAGLDHRDLGPVARVSDRRGKDEERFQCLAGPRR